VQFAAAAVERGVGAVYAFPLQVGGARLGVLTAYAAAGRRLSAPELAIGLERAERARDLLLDPLDDSVEGVDGADGADAVARSLPLRTQVYQAQGILMTALGISLAEALVRLRATAYAEDLDLNVLAADLVSGRRAVLTEDDDAR